MCINPDFALALEHAVRYREMGLTPLPSRMDEKRPALNGYAQYRQEPVPDSLYTQENWQTSNIQLMTGACVQGHTRGRPGLLRILVVDLDGMEARDQFRKLCNHHGMIKEYWVSESPSGGRHVYLEIPWDVECITTRMIWGLVDTDVKTGRFTWSKHCEIKLLGDGALAVAPPSIHVGHRKSKKRYKFLRGFSPDDHAKPTVAPDWLLSFPVAKLPAVKEKELFGNGKPVQQLLAPRPGAGLPIPDSMAEISESISADQKIAYLRDWGVRFVGDVKPNGWIECHSILVDDSVPSAGVCADMGLYKDHRTGEVIYFFHMGVRLGRFTSAWECAKWCAYGRTGMTGPVTAPF